MRAKGMYRYATILSVIVMGLVPFGTSHAAPASYDAASEMQSSVVEGFSLDYWPYYPYIYRDQFGQSSDSTAWVYNDLSDFRPASLRTTHSTAEVLADTRLEWALLFGNQWLDEHVGQGKIRLARAPGKEGSPETGNIAAKMPEGTPPPPAVAYVVIAIAVVSLGYIFLKRNAGRHLRR